MNTSHSDPKKTGGLYGVQDVMNNAPSKDDQWFNYYIKVEGKHVIIKIDGKTTVDWTEPENVGGRAGRKIDQGTFAIQGHDPKSLVYFKNIKVRPLDPIKVVVVTGGHDFEHDPFFKLFQGYSDIQYVEAAQKDHSELFEDISNWDYDVIVLYNMIAEYLRRSGRRTSRPCSKRASAWSSCTTPRARSTRGKTTARSSGPGIRSSRRRSTASSSPPAPTTTTWT